MKTLQFWVIALAIIMLSSCGGKDKLTTDNATPVLDELLGYPCVLAQRTRIAGNDLVSYFSTLNLISTSDNRYNSRSQNTFTSIYDWQRMAPFLAKGDKLEVSSRFRTLPKSITGNLPVYLITIKTIEAVSEEVDGKVTVQFMVNFIPTSLGELPFRERIEGIKWNKYDEQIMTAELQRTEDGWMVTNRDDFKSKFKHSTFYSFDDYIDISLIVSEKKLGEISDYLDFE
jgi:hypothetical protein